MYTKKCKYDVLKSYLYVGLLLIMWATTKFILVKEWPYKYLALSVVKESSESCLYPVQI
jgi:hypothetical protein